MSPFSITIIIELVNFPTSIDDAFQWCINNFKTSTLLSIIRTTCDAVSNNVENLRHEISND